MIQKQMNQASVEKETIVPDRILATISQLKDGNIEQSMAASAEKMAYMANDLYYARELLKSNGVSILASSLETQAKFASNEFREAYLKALTRTLSKIASSSSSYEQLYPLLDVLSAAKVSVFSKWLPALGRLLYDTMVSTVKKIQEEQDHAKKKQLLSAFVSSVGVLVEKSPDDASFIELVQAMCQVFPDLELTKLFLKEYENVLRMIFKRCAKIKKSDKLVAVVLMQLKNSFLQGTVEEEDEAVKNLANTLKLLYTDLSENGSLVDKINALTVVSHAFQVHISLGKEILLSDGFLENICDCLEFEPSEYQSEALELLSYGCADKDSRNKIGALLTDFLKLTSSSGNTDTLKNMASLILTKIESGAKPDPLLTQAGGAEAPKGSTEADKIRMADNYIQQILASKPEKSSQDRAVLIEGLALLTINAGVKDHLVRREDFIKHLLAIAKTAGGAEAYGISLILDQLSAYRKKRSAEEEQMQKLREFAKESLKQTDDPRDNDDAVNKRVAKLAKIGILSVLTILVKNAVTNASKEHLANIYVNFATQSGLRGQMVQAGAVKALLSLTQVEKAPENAPDPDEKYPKYVLHAAQSLAKLAISQDPHIAFPATASSFVRPLLYLLETSNELYQFEALMALTNLASMRDQNGEVVTRKLSDPKNMSLIQNAIFSDNKRVQQAGVETLCNLVGAKVCADYVGKSQNWMKLIVALSNAEEIGTRKASGGAFAIVTAISAEARENTFELDIAPRILSTMIKDSDWEIQWRGLEVLKELANHSPTDKKKSFMNLFIKEIPDLTKRISALTKSETPPLQASAVSTLMALQGMAK